MRRAWGMRATLLCTALPYLLLVTFYPPVLTGLDSLTLDQLVPAPYDGVAVQLVDPYDTATLTAGEIANAVAALRARGAGPHVWPWVFFNRFVGYDPAGHPHKGNNPVEAFSSIAGMDLKDERGALSSFLDNWRSALALARETGAPGIVVDPEAYNNYQAYDLAFVARAQGMSEHEAAFRLRLIGQRLVEISDETYPDAVLWFLFTGISKDGPIEELSMRSTTINIILGMLSTARLTGSRVTLVSGGEGSIGYCNRTPDDLARKIARREEQTLGIRNSYPALRLGGTIAPWADAARRIDWMVNTPACRDSSARGAVDFIPYFEALGERYEYVWIYAAWAANYNPYATDDARPIHDALAEAMRYGPDRCPPDR